MEFLIDTGSHNNFIQEGLVTKLGLLNVPAKRFKVYMGNGQSFLCDHMCSSIPLILQGHEFVIDLYVLPIWGLDITLGMQWLRTLGPCVHDHEALTMEFSWKGKRVFLSSNSVPSLDTVMYNQLCALLHTEAIAHVYTLQVVGSSLCSNIAPSWVDLSSNCATLPMTAFGGI